VTALIEQVVDAFNRHGSFTARATDDTLAVELRAVDTGEYLGIVWMPGNRGNWGWNRSEVKKYRSLPRATMVEEVVRAVATSLLDEEPNR
jgi:hypothetical protein